MERIKSSQKWCKNLLQYCRLAVGTCWANPKEGNQKQKVTIKYIIPKQSDYIFNLYWVHTNTDCSRAAQKEMVLQVHLLACKLHPGIAWPNYATYSPMEKIILGGQWNLVYKSEAREHIPNSSLTLLSVLRWTSTCSTPSHDIWPPSTSSRFLGGLNICLNLRQSLTCLKAHKHHKPKYVFFK